MAKFCLLLAAIGVVVVSVSSRPDAGQFHKIHKSLQASLLLKSNVNVFVEIDGGTRAALQKAKLTLNAASTHGERTTTVYNALREHTEYSQKPILDFIQTAAPSLKVQSFWITNQIYIQNVTRSIVEAIADLEQVTGVHEEVTSHIKNHLVERSESTQGLRRESGKAAEWALEKMRVPEVWNMEGGNNGEGLVIGNIDTGVRGSHELLKNKWVGAAGYGWYDPENKTTVSHDIYNHGKILQYLIY